MAASQKIEHTVEATLLRDVGRKLCGGERRRVKLADLERFFDLTAYYCKQRRSIKQVVYEQLAPVVTLGVTVKVPSLATRPTKPFTLVTIKMANRSQMCIASALALIIYMLHINDAF